MVSVPTDRSLQISWDALAYTDATLSYFSLPYEIIQNEQKLLPAIPPLP
ncbi:757_t:CDS:2 [Ambispora leptoticha]|uniref:757_t:CDS:1 n=1 Tax=Ambispora leptoticha TaxID=144679 RepID=A0A9N9F3V7_9GLOM|nr:757_t:CDS:2 [Ambispora leptoticha]